MNKVIDHNLEAIEQIVHDALQGQNVAYDTSSQGLLAQDAEGVLVYYDKGAANIFGYTIEEAIGMPSATLVPNNPVNPDYIKARQELFDRVLATGNPEEIRGTQRRTKSGDVITIDAVVFRYQLSGVYSIAALVKKVG